MSFHSPRLQFSKFDQQDFQAYWSLVSNLEVMRQITGAALTEKEARTKFDRILDINQQHQDLGVFKVFHRETEAFIGLAKVVGDQAASAEIGYTLLPQFWRQQFGSEMAQAMVERGKNTKGIAVLTAITDPENTASNKILTNLNFQLKEKGFYEGFPAYFFHCPLYPPKK